MYIKLINGQEAQFPYTFQDLRKDNPETSFPPDPDDETLAGFSVQKVAETAAPSVDGKTHRLVQSAALVEGVWTQQWEVEPLPMDQANANVRDERNERLAGCDWTQLTDAPVDAAEWATYRQELRDVTTQEGFPWEVVWPLEPGTVLVRARDELGQFVGDDPTTPENEAWTEPSA